MRKLAAIMFTDIVGYTALMGEDEAKALQLLQKNRGLLKPIIEQFRGEWLKEMGDGTLSSFASAVDAVNCALAIQQVLKDDPDLKLRIGIHIGDVVFEGGDVFGDGVNVASRIEPLADPGGICVSERVYEDIRNKAGIEAASLGEKKLKGVENPVKVYTVTAMGALPRKPAWPSITNRSLWTKAAGMVVVAMVAVAAVILLFLREMDTHEVVVPRLGEKSIAVLPFANLSDSKEDEYFSDGMTDDIITHLTKIGDLKVISRTSIMLYKDSPKSLRVIAEELGVSNILEGTVRRHGNRVRITGQLIDARTDEHLWAETYDRDLTDIFAIQSDVARNIAASLKAILSPEERQRIEKWPTESTEAYHLYLRGQYFWEKKTAEDLFKAIGYFEKAIEADSAYAQAYVGLADTYLWLGHFEIPPEQAVPIAREALARARKIDSHSAEAYASLAHMMMEHEWDWEGAESAYQRAIELNPSYAEAHRLYSIYFMLIGQPDKAIAEMKRAQELDPLSYLINTQLALPYMLLGQFDQAFEYFRKSLELNPDFPLTYFWLGQNYTRAGRYAEAIEAHEKAVALGKGDAWLLGALGYTYGVAGHRDKALAILRELQAMSKRKYIPSYSMVLAHIGIGELDQALDWLEKGYQAGEFLIAQINFPLFFDSLRPDPRFQDLLMRMNFPE